MQGEPSRAGRIRDKECLCHFNEGSAVSEAAYQLQCHLERLGQVVKSRAKVVVDVGPPCNPAFKVNAPVANHRREAHTLKLFCDAVVVRTVEGVRGTELSATAGNEFDRRDRPGRADAGTAVLALDKAARCCVLLASMSPSTTYSIVMAVSDVGDEETGCRRPPNDYRFCCGRVTVCSNRMFGSVPHGETAPRSRNAVFSGATQAWQVVSAQRGPPATAERLRPEHTTRSKRTCSPDE